MATPSDKARKTAKKATKSTARKSTAQPSAKSAAGKTQSGKAQSKTSQSSKPQSGAEFEFDFKDSASGTKVDYLGQARAHAEKGLEELVVAAVHTTTYVNTKLDAAAIKARREAKAAYSAGTKWASEHPVAASVASSAALTAATSAVKKLFKR